MKKSKLGVLAILGVACLMAAGMHSGSAEAQAGLPSGTFDITFDGFCDGMNLTIAKKVLLAGVLTGCASGSAAGNISFNYETVTFPQPVVGANVTSTDLPGCALFYQFNFGAQTWANYKSCDGTGPHMINSGTYTRAQAKNLGGKRSSEK